MWLIIFFAGLFFQVQSLTPLSGTHLANESRSQADRYINHISRKENTDYNLWALTLLGSGNKSVRQYIEQKIEGSEYQDQALLSFKSFKSTYRLQLRKVVFQTGSVNLLIDLLLKTEHPATKKALYNQYKSKFGSPRTTGNIDYPALCQSIINNEKITSDILPNNRFLFPHLFLLFDSNRSHYMKEDYIRNIIQQWIFNNRDEDSLPYILSKITLFRSYYLSDEYNKTRPFYNILINNRLFPNTALKLQIYRNLDYAMYRLGYYDRNLRIARQFTLPLAQYLELEDLELKIKFAMGINLYSIGKYQAAKEIYQRILEKIDNNHSTINQSSIYNNLSITYIKLGKYDKYLDLQFQALNKAKEKKNYSHQLDIYNNLFIYYKHSRNSNLALNYLRESRKLAETHGSLKDLGRNYISTGTFNKNFKNNLQKAQEYFKKAANLLNSENDSRFFIYLLSEEAKVYKRQKRFNRALKNYEQILHLTKKKDKVSYLEALVNKAQIYLKIEQDRKAKAFIDKFRSYDLGILDFSQIIKAKTVEAQYLNDTGDPDQALQLLEPALDQVVERARNSAELESGFWHVEDEYLDAFELVVTILNNNGKSGKAIEQLDRLKNINAASLYQSPLVRSRQLSETELTQYKQLTAQLDAARKRLILAPESRQFDIQQTINMLKLKKRQLDKKVTDQADRKSITIREIRNRLSARDLVIHTTELNNKFYIAYITRSKVSLKVKPLDNNKMHLFSKAAEQIASNQTNLDSLYAVSRYLGIQHIPDRIRNITVIPDNYLYQLPVDILPLNKPAHRYSYGQVSYWVDKYTTSYLTSLDDFMPGKRPKPDSQYKWNFVGYGISNFGDADKNQLVPLPYAKKEITDISQDLTNFTHKKILINQASTKEVFRQTAPKARVLHLATHSKVSERDPLFSSIYMSDPSEKGSNSFKDQIFAYELFELKLNNEMIMLNSCESGSGSYIQGTGIKGISRSLRYAGAHSLVLNLWSVNDMLTSEFAVHFYKLLNEGKSKSEALQNTKRYFLKTKNASPHYWGPYLLIGNTTPLVHPNRTMNIAMAGAFLVYFLLMAGLSYLKDRGVIFKKTPPRNL